MQKPCRDCGVIPNPLPNRWGRYDYRCNQCVRKDYLARYHIKPQLPAPYRFNNFVKIDSLGCWIWKGGKLKCGYGRFEFNRKDWLAHRWSYEFFMGPIPPKLQLDHLCRQRDCVNPKHLEVVTNRENWRRGMSPTAIAARKKDGQVIAQEIKHENTD